MDINVTDEVIRAIDEYLRKSEIFGTREELVNFVLRKVLLEEEKIEHNRDAIRAVEQRLRDLGYL